MKKWTVCRCSALIILFAGVIFTVSAKNTFAQNTINGLILDENRNPIGNIQVELLNEYERLIGSTKTSSSGIYTFQGIRVGIYYVRVRVDGTNYKQTKERIQIGQTNHTDTLSGRTLGTEFLQVDLVLEIDPQRQQGGDQTFVFNEIVFAQNIPKEAEKSYEKALKNLKEKKRDEGTKQLQTALEIFPDYFLALNRLGYEYFEQNKFTEAENAFKRASEINPKNFSSKYGLSISQYKLAKRGEAIKTLIEATVINPASINSFFLLGKIYRELKEFDKAEANLKKAKELSVDKLADVHWELALLYYYNFNRFSEAANELEHYLRANPNAGNKEQVKKLIETFREKAKQKKT